MVMNGCERSGACQVRSIGKFLKHWWLSMQILVCDSENIESYIKADYLRCMPKNNLRCLWDRYRAPPANEDKVRSWYQERYCWEWVLLSCRALCQLLLYDKGFMAPHSKKILSWLLMLKKTSFTISCSNEAAHERWTTSPLCPVVTVY